LEWVGRLKGRTPIYFDFGRSKINFNHPNVAGVGRLLRLPTQYAF
jgi:hypothetical protein